MGDAGPGGEIHEEHPFVTPPGERDPLRRLRGRLVLPVTVVTAGSEDDPAGLTVSSLMVAEGEPPLVYLLVGPTTDLYYALEDRGRFVVHVVDAGNRRLADVFAGLRPAPGGPFTGLAVDHGDHGPVITELASRLHCSVVAMAEESYSVLVTGAIDRTEVAALDDPLTYFRGTYRKLAPGGSSPGSP